MKQKRNFNLKWNRVYDKQEHLIISRHQYDLPFLLPVHHLPLNMLIMTSENERK